MNTARVGFALLACVCLLTPARAEEQTIKVRVTGLFSKERAEDFRAILIEWGDCKLMDLDFNHAEAQLRFDPAKLLPQAKPDQYVTRLDEKLRNSSNHTMGVKPPSATPHDKLKRVEIPLAAIDCKACCLAVYEIVARVEGVEQATATMKDGLVTALIDPAKTDKAKLEEALKQRGVALKQP